MQRFHDNAPVGWNPAQIPAPTPAAPIVTPDAVVPFPTALPPAVPQPAISVSSTSRSASPASSTTSSESSPPVRRQRLSRAVKRARVESSSPEVGAPPPPEGADSVPAQDGLPVPDVITSPNVVAPDIVPAPDVLLTSNIFPALDALPESDILATTDVLPPPDALATPDISSVPEIKPEEATFQPGAWPEVRSKPYRQQAELELIRRGVKKLNQRAVDEFEGPIVYHMDFTDGEIAQIVNWCNAYQSSPSSLTRESLRTLIKGEMPVLAVVNGRLEGRTEEDIRNFCSDLLAGRTTGGRILSLATEPVRQTPSIDSQISSLLFARELEGNRGFGRTRRYMNFQSSALRALESQLEIYAQFANCAGDVATISWVSKNNLICGTTTHSDTHNQQYNKPGNLLLCSTQDVTLRAFPDHRIPRPIVSTGDNSTREMRHSQDPWLYSSVVSSDYDPVRKLAYTSSFDRTVKVWRTDENGKCMECLATWHHDGNVNFVVAAKDGSGRVASGADVPTEAVRIYTVDEDNIAASPYYSISCTRTDADTDRWAYFPATMQWGKGTMCRHILAIGYSPRSTDGDDSKIPDDKTNTGEIMLWNATSCSRIPLLTATTANVFEVVWHPRLERFIAATSPCGVVEHGARTQVHIFQRDRDRVEPVYCEYQSLDCPASDINELTLMPNSLLHAYVTAACTDGKVYVWDTAHSSRPMHVLEHAQSLEVFDREHLEKLDTGVKFTAWGKTADHFYTGASDGVVRVWNIRNRKQPYIRTLLSAPAPISCGAFSPDLTKLAVGDATGRLYLFSLDQRDAPTEQQHVTLPNGRKVRMPIPFIPHAEPPPPSSPSAGDPMIGVVTPSSAITPSEPAQDDSGIALGRFLLESEMLAPSGEPTIGVVQGPNYEQMGLFRRDAHESEDPSGPLLTSYEKVQQQSVRADRGFRRRSLRRLGDPISNPNSSLDSSFETAHRDNMSWENSVNTLGEDELAELAELGAILSLDDDLELAYESGSEC